MEGRSLVLPQKLTPVRELQTLVENRLVFTMEHCEMNIFETYQQSEQVSLRFDSLVYTAMLRGKKVMHLFGDRQFDYLPGESVILPSNERMVIDFPEATIESPAQCIALTIDEDKVRKTLELLNEKYTRAEGQWALDSAQFHIRNTQEISHTVERLIRVAKESNPAKDVFADMALQELLLRLMQTQARHLIFDNYREYSATSRFATVILHIQERLHENLTIGQLSNIACMSKPHFFRSFRQEFGISPVEYIIRERLKLARRLLKEPQNRIAEVSYQCGFQSVNYFCTLFKKYEGVSPGQFKKNQSPA